MPRTVPIFTKPIFDNILLTTPVRNCMKMLQKGLVAGSKSRTAGRGLFIRLFFLLQITSKTRLTQNL